MRHKLDYRPIPDDVLYINELDLADRVPYITIRDMERALTGKCEKEGGILPNDNVRIYVPIDINAEYLMWRLNALFVLTGYPTEENESAYSDAVRRIISQLEIYDQMCVTRNFEESIQKELGGVRHSREGIELAGRIVEYLEDNDGTAECFPWDEIEELRKEFWL